MRDMHFPLAEGGRLELRGDSYLSSFLPLGALLHTKRLKHEPLRDELQTDLEGLESAYDMAEEARHGIADLLEIIGYFAAHADAKEIPSHIWNSIGWSLVGLSGLLRDADEVAHIAAHQLREANTSKPEAQP